MTHEDRITEPLLSRREVLIFLGTTGAAWLMAGSLNPKLVVAGTVVPSCVVRPEQTEGPYCVDERLNRSDIRSDPSDGSVKEGVPLQLALRVHEIRGKGCLPLAGAMVDIWHCDARGVYSDVRERFFDTRRKKFLRGYQTTDADGAVRYQAIYPG